MVKQLEEKHKTIEENIRTLWYKLQQYLFLIILLEKWKYNTKINKWDLIKLKTFWRVKYKSFLFKIFPCSENPFHPIVYTLTRSSTHSTMTDYLHLQAHCNDRMFSVIFLIEVKLVYNIVWVSCVNVMIWCMCSLRRVITRFWLPCISITWCPAVVQLLSHVRLFATPWTATCQTISWHYYLPELAQTLVHWVSDAI